jgi:Rrf2 family protein
VQDEYMSLRNVQFAVATHIMVVLGYRNGEEVSSRLLAESVNANPTFVRKSLSKLAKAGLVVTRRGKAGASTLARPAARITLLDIYRASGSPAAFVTHSYPVESECIVSRNFKICMSGVLSEVQSGLEQSLSKITLAKLTRKAQKSLPRA